MNKPVRYHKKKTLGVLRRFCPDWHVPSVRHIDPESLKKDGYEAILLDLDNTLIPWKGMHIPDETHKWIESVKNAGLKMCLVSNTRNVKRLKLLSEKLDIPHVRGRYKPAKSGFEKALKLIGATPEKTVMIGDQIFTDVWGGNRMGMKTIWVRPMHHREFIGTKFSRMAEKVITRFFPKHEESP